MARSASTASKPRNRQVTYETLKFNVRIQNKANSQDINLTEMVRAAAEERGDKVVVRELKNGTTLTINSAEWKPSYASAAAKEAQAKKAVEKLRSLAEINNMSFEEFVKTVEAVNGSR